MPLQFKSKSLNVEQVFKALHLPKDSSQKAQANGLVVKFKLENQVATLTFYLESDPKTTAKVLLAPKTGHELINGDVKGAPLHVAQSKVVQAVKKLLPNFQDFHIASGYDAGYTHEAGVQPELKAGIAKLADMVDTKKTKLGDMAFAALAEAEQKSQDITDESGDTPTPVKLTEATYIGQQVKGTSSTYRFMGQAGGLYAAARVITPKPGVYQLSVRIEGALSSCPAITSELTKLGLSVSSNGYMSGHYSQLDELRLKAVLSVVGGVVGLVNYPRLDMLHAV